MILKHLYGAVLALALSCVISGCVSSGGSAPPATASVAAPEPAVQTAAAAPAPAATPAPATAKAPPAKPGAQLSTVAAAPAALPGICSMPVASIPPVPSVAGSVAGSVAENAGRNVARNVGAGVANSVVGSVIPGFGAVVGQAAVNTASTEVVKTAEDMRGAWTATDGAGCGCALEFSKPGMVMTKKVVTPKGCRAPLWAHAARWNVASRGIGKTDLVFIAKDGKTELARLDMKSRDYYQGSVNGELVTIWR